MAKTFVYIKDYTALADELFRVMQERDQAIKERDALKEELDKRKSEIGYFRSYVKDQQKLRCDASIKEINHLRKESGILQKRVSEARYWARKMMAERDEYKKLYDELIELQTSFRHTHSVTAESDPYCATCGKKLYRVLYNAE